MVRKVKQGTTGGAKTRVYFFLVDATDYVTPETGEAGGQPQISTDGAAWTNTGIGTLTHIGTGRYYADLTTAAVASGAPKTILARYKSSNTAEAIGTSYIVTVNDPANETQSVSLAAGAVTTASIQDGAITAAKLGANAVTSTVVADGFITAAKIGADAITNAKIADNAISAENIASSAIAESKIGSAALVAAKFGTDLNVYGIGQAKLTKVSGSAQRVTFFVVANGAPVPHATFASEPTATVITTGGTTKFDDAPTEFGGNGGYYIDLTGGNILSAGDSAELTVNFTIGANSYTRTALVELNAT